MVQAQESQNRRNSTGVHLHTTTGTVNIESFRCHQLDDAINTKMNAM